MPDKDTLQILHEFSSDVADALNKAGVKGGQPDSIKAVMLVVAQDEDTAPLGASLNFEDGEWTVFPQANLSEPCDDDD